MIKNKRSESFTKSQIHKLKSQLEEVQENLMREELSRSEKNKLKTVQESLMILVAKMEGEIKEYEKLKDGKWETIELKGIYEIPELLIKARIAKGLTHKQLAEKLGWKAQQIQRYEASDYDSIGFGNLALIEYALGIHENIEIIYKNEKGSSKVIDMYNQTEFDLPDDINKENIKKILKRNQLLAI